MLNKLYIWFLLLLTIQLHAQQRSDTFGIKHIYIDAQIEYTGSILLKAATRLDIKALKTTNGILPLDLLKLNVDSVYINNQKESYTYNDTLLQITLDKVYQQGDSFSATIYYQGNPVMDASGWGGFYKSPPYIFNLGVGFDAAPHSYGRVWFPCFDDFVTKSTYSFAISVDSNYTAVCNGLNTGKSYIGNRAIYTYSLKEKIPSYLACVAVAPYTFYKSNYNGIPVEVAALPKDTANTRILFTNLNACMKGFEHAYGPYAFEKIGYSLVPFNGGAMEHATNIALPVNSANGTKAQETLWAHELSHHWWGDHITCKSDSDMWLNEGWASYSESLFLESAYGKDVYQANIADNHLYVLQYAHIADSGYRAVAGVPHDYVYGRTVYKKGADMVHSMRGIFGDSAFFQAARDFQRTYSFNSATTEDLRNICYKYVTDKKMVDDYFDHWIKQPGFVHFAVISNQTQQNNGKYETSITLTQRTKGTVIQYEHVPVDVYFFGADRTMEKETYILGKWDTQIKHIGNFTPVYICIDYNQKLSDAISDDAIVHTKRTDTIDFIHGKMKLYITNNADTALIRVEHHWVAPEGKVNTSGVYLHTGRYWTVGGVLPVGFAADARIFYNGQKSTNDGYLDNDFIRITEDSLVLLYRAKPEDAWEIYPDYIKYMQNVNDKKGNILIKKLKLGDYSLGMYDKKLGLDIQPTLNAQLFDAYPNPAQEAVHLNFAPLHEKKTVEIYSSDGKLIYQKGYAPDVESTTIPINTNHYILIKVRASQLEQTKKIIILP